MGFYKFYHPIEDDFIYLGALFGWLWAFWHILSLGFSNKKEVQE